jgi:hypothetical protein
MGGDIPETALRVAGSFDYVFHFSSIRKDRVKKLTAIYEMGLSDDGERAVMNEICLYDRLSDSWRWTYHIGRDKRDIGIEEDADAFAAFEVCLKGISGRGCQAC